MICRLLLAALALIALASNAEARHRHKHHHAAVVYVAHPDCNIVFPCAGVTTSPRGEEIVRSMGGFGSAQKIYSPRTELQPHPSGCPSRAFCGCGAAIRVFGHSVRSLWLAANWLRFPRSEPAPGMAAARRGHVFVLEQHISGSTWLVYDANSGGHATRIHARSIAGFTVVNPHGGAA